MKALARSTVWWPGIDGDIEWTVRARQRCQEMRPEPLCARLDPWEYAKNPWSTIHTDFAGSFQGTVFLLVVDARSEKVGSASFKNYVIDVSVLQIARLVRSTRCCRHCSLGQWKCILFR